MRTARSERQTIRLTAPLRPLGIYLYLPFDVRDGISRIDGRQEMTNWFHGHTTVTGLDPGQWLDWRQRPRGVPLLENEARITEFVATAKELGAYTAAAHPASPGPGLTWSFLAEGPADPAALPDGWEVWTGTFQPDNQTAVDTWDAMLQNGTRITANGGSDLHGTDNQLQPGGPGQPTTVVYASQLSPTAIVQAVRAGRCFVTRAPDGGEVYLTATRPGGQRTFTGGTIVGAPTDTVDVEVLVRCGPLLRAAPSVRLVVIASGGQALVQPITAEEQTVGVTLPIGPAGGYVRAELRSHPVADPARPWASRLDMKALTNPIWLATVGEPVQEEAPPPEPHGTRTPP